MPVKFAIKHESVGVVLFLLMVAIAQFYWLHSANHILLKAALADAFGSTVCLYILCLCINYIPEFKTTNQFDFVYNAVYVFILSLLWVYCCEYIFINIFSSDTNYILFWKNNLFIRGFLAWIILYVYKIIGYLNDKLRNAENTIHEEKQIQQLRNDAELFKLRQQLQPHFLFNSLNSINALIGREPQKARQMMQQLSDYLRNSLKKEDEKFIPFDEEINDLRLYLAIEQVRFGHRLLVKENITNDCDDIKVPPFLLQPLVENAIKFGLYGTIGTVTIIITVKKENNELVFIIVNPYDADSVTTKGTGFGLESIQRRLYLLFARNDLLKTEHSAIVDENNLRTFTAILKIPLINSK